MIYSENNNLMSDEGSKEEEFFLEKDININTNSIINENDNEILNYISKGKNSINFEIKDEDLNYEYLFSIIIDDYQKTKNYNHIETISNVEKFLNLYYIDYNEINLNYEIKKENIKNNSIEIFGEIFVNNNKENCFLIINEKLMDLNRFINLDDIYDNIHINY